MTRGSVATATKKSSIPRLFPETLSFVQGIYMIGIISENQTKHKILEYFFILSISEKPLKRFIILVMVSFLLKLSYFKNV
jgi:hypothetical protein